MSRSRPDRRSCDGYAGIDCKLDSCIEPRERRNSMTEIEVPIADQSVDCERNLGPACLLPQSFLYEHAQFMYSTFPKSGARLGKCEPLLDAVVLLRDEGGH